MDILRLEQNGLNSGHFLSSWNHVSTIDAFHHGLMQRGIAIMSAGIALGMSHIHARGQVHGYLSPSNILIDDVGRLHLDNIGVYCDNDIVKGLSMFDPHYFV
jgi:serine/threonine protein kinase